MKESQMKETLYRWFEGSREAIWICDEAGRGIYGNAAYRALVQIEEGHHDSLAAFCECLAEPEAGQTQLLTLMLREEAKRDIALETASGKALLIDYRPLDADRHTWTLREDVVSPSSSGLGGKHWTSAVLSEALDAIVTIDSDGLVVDWNSAAEATFGHSKEEALGQDMGALIVPDDLHAQHRAGMKRYLQTGESRVLGGRVELAAKHKDGHIFPCELSIAEFREGGKSFFTGFLRDISNRKEAEIAMAEAKDAAESANHAKDRFLATMSHEIRTPLNVMLGMVELLQDTRLTMTQLEYLRAVEDSGEVLLQLINDFLDLSKLDASQIELVEKPFDLHDLLLRVSSLIGLRLEPKGIHMRCQIDASVPSVILGDPNRLQQILLNLMGNAAKFTHEGSIVLRVDVVEGDEQPNVAFSVIDTGIGIQEDAQSQIFERFYQADQTSHRRYEGTGLGLSICRALAELMGGSLSLVSSQPGKGSHFCVHLPLKEADATFSPILPADGEGDSTSLSQHVLPTVCSILLAEDNIDNRMYAERVLRQVGHQVDCVNDGLAAIEAFQQKQYNLVLMDLEMPLCDGLEATRRIRAWEQEQGREPTPIAAFTAHALKGYRQKSLDAGMDDYFTKPLRRIDLLSLVAKLAGHPAPEASTPPPASRILQESDKNIIVQIEPDLADLVPLYLDNRKREVATLQELMIQRDFSELARLAHRFKGTAGGYGFPQISQFGAQIEEAAQQRDIESLQTHISSMSDYLQKVEWVTAP